MQAYYFRSDTGSGQPRFYVPVSLIVPGSQIPFVKGGDRSKATLDIIGELKNTAGQDMAEIRQTVKLAIDDSQQVSRKNIQYTTGFTLPLGKYHLKFVVRENETGKMGTYQQKFIVPDLTGVLPMLPTSATKRSRASMPSANSRTTARAISAGSTRRSTRPRDANGPWST